MRKLYEYYLLRNYVIQAKSICDERSAFEYTGIEVAGIVLMLAKGDSIERKVEDYEGRTSREAILDATCPAVKQVRRNGRSDASHLFCKLRKITPGILSDGFRLDTPFSLK
jgi:uncharacterized protein (DUF433 family)